MKVFLKDGGTISEVTKKVFADFNAMSANSSCGNTLCSRTHI